jgi:inner membrane protein
MDSFTHVVLGAATGEAILGRKVGNKAMVWGALAGSIPDFDVAVTWLFEPVKALFVHRGFSHSLVFTFLLAPLLGLIISRIHRDASFRQWAWLSLWAMLGHNLIDCFNTYGTALLEPFSDVRLAFDSIGIIDLILLVPALIALITAIFSSQRSTLRRVLSFAILGYTVLFVTYSVVIKMQIERKVKVQVSEQKIDYLRIKTAPLPFTNFLWLVLVEDSVGYHYGYLGNFDKREIDFKFIHRNSEELGELKYHQKVANLIRFADGFYSVNRKPDGSLWLYDLRFGSMAFDDEDNWFVFSFRIWDDGNNGVQVSRSHPNRSFGISTFRAYWKRVFGK